MDVNELLAQAWAAVQRAGIPEPSQPVALKEAIRFLQSEGKGSDQPGDPKGDRNRTVSPREETANEAPDEETFFADLASESGESEQELRDVLQLTSDNKVQITPPTRDLGSSITEQAKTAIALVASGRGRGLHEKPVQAKAVREELGGRTATTVRISRRITWAS